MSAVATRTITATQLTAAPVVAQPRVFLRCGPCRADTVFVVGRAGFEVRECFGCGRRAPVHAKHRRDRRPSRFPW